MNKYFHFNQLIMISKNMKFKKNYEISNWNLTFAYVHSVCMMYKFAGFLGLNSNFLLKGNSKNKKVRLEIYG